MCLSPTPLGDAPRISDSRRSISPIDRVQKSADILAQHSPVSINTLFNPLLQQQGQVPNSLTPIKASSPTSPVSCSWNGARNMAPVLAAARRKTICVLKTSYSACFCNGKPMCRNSASVSPLVFAVVTMVIARPNTSFNSSSDVSGKIVCSRTPIV